MQPVVRTLNVLRVLGQAERGMSLQELCDVLSIPLGSMHRVLSVLSDERFITRSQTNKKYFLGPAARELANEGTRPHGALVAPHPALGNLADVTGETVFMTELVGDRAICISLVEGQYPLRLFVRIGQEMPLHAAASARVLLADLDDSTVIGLLARHPMTAFTKETPATIEDVVEHLTMIRARGYDVCDDELDKGVWAVAAPVYTSTGRICASVTLAAPSGRMAIPQIRDTAISQVTAAAAAMAADLGHVPAGEPDRTHGASLATDPQHRQEDKKHAPT